MNLANTDCAEHNFLCEVVPLHLVCSPKTGDHNEPDHIEADKESHDGEIPCELFCVTGK